MSRSALHRGVTIDGNQYRLVTMAELQARGEAEPLRALRDRIRQSTDDDDEVRILVEQAVRVLLPSLPVATLARLTIAQRLAVIQAWSLVY